MTKYVSGVSLKVSRDFRIHVASVLKDCEDWEEEGTQEGHPAPAEQRLGN